MTMSPGEPGPTDPAEGSAVPPYEGRQETADVDGDEKMEREGATTAGATGPVESDQRKAAEPADTPGGAVASPADEQPAAQSGGPDPGEESVGPAHRSGTGRGEDA